jgi:hypothetical protein
MAMMLTNSAFGLRASFGPRISVFGLLTSRAQFSFWYAALADCLLLLPCAQVVGEEE